MGGTHRAVWALMMVAACDATTPAPCEEIEKSLDDAHALMRCVVATYHGLTSYQDQGVVLWPGPSELRFTTHYRRPGDFRFEWNHRRRYVVWASARGTFSYWEARPRIETWRGLDSVISAHTGVSYSAITTIPGLVFGRDKGFPSVGDIHDLSILEPDDFEGTPCVRVRGVLRGAAVEIWIGRDDFLIRKIITHMRHPAEHSLSKFEEIRRELRFNHAIPDATFDFHP